MFAKMCIYIYIYCNQVLSIYPSISTKHQTFLLTTLGSHRESIRICGVHNPRRCNNRTRFGWCDITWHNLEDSETQRFHPTCGMLNAYLHLEMKLTTVYLMLNRH